MSDQQPPDDRPPGQHEVVTEDLGDDALANRALSAPPAVAKPALRALVAQRSSRRTAVLTEVLADGRRGADLRAMAALHLGRDNRQAHRDALHDALVGSPAPVRRRCAEALGRIGDEESHERLGRLRPSDPVVRASVDFARTLISYRLGLGTDLVEAPHPAHLGERSRRSPMETGLVPADDEVTAAALADAEVHLPADPLSPDAALQLTCGHDLFHVAFERTVHERVTLGPLTERNALLVVVQRRAATLDEFEPFIYVLSHPDGDDRVRLVGVRTIGEVVLTGEAQVEDGTATFELSAVASPHQVPLDLAGSYHHDERRLELTTHRIDQDFAPGVKRSRTPQPGVPTSG